MRTLIHSAAYWNGAGGEVVERGYAVLSGGRIEAIAPGDAPEQAGPFDDTVDGRNRLLLPGFINAHGHAAMSLLRGFADDMPLETWLRERIWPAEDRLTPADVRIGTELAMLEMIETGTTTFTDMYFHTDQTAEAALSAGMRAVLGRGIVSVSGRFERMLADSEALIRTYHNAGGGLVRMTLAPHALYTCPPAYIRKILPAAERTGVPLQIHIAETAAEAADAMREYGMTPVAALAQSGLFHHPVTAAHCVHATDADIATMAAYGVRIAHNPGSNLKLGSGVAPLQKFLAAGIAVGLGTDSAASNNKLDLYEEMRLAALLHKGVDRNACAVGARAALSLAAAGGADALFLPGDLGRLSPGAPADLQLLDISGPRYAPRHNLLAHAVYSSCGADVTDVFVAGKALYRRREFLTIDRERTLFEAERIGVRLRRADGANGIREAKR